MASSRPFAVSAALTAIAIAYRNPAYSFIADQVLPYVPVPAEKFKWTFYDLAQGFTVPETRVGRKGRVNEVEFTGQERDGSTEDHGLDAPVPNSDINEARRLRELNLSTYDPEKVAAQFLADLMLLRREIRASAVVQNPSNYVAANRVNIVDADDRFDTDGSDPYAILDELLSETLGPRPNTVAMGQPVWTKIKKHPRLIKAVKGGLTDEGAITKQQLAELLEVRQVLVGESRLNVAMPGQEANLQRVWGKSIQGLFINPTVTTEMGMTWGYTARLGDKFGGTIEDSDVGLEGGVKVRVGEKSREMTVAPELGFIIQNAVS
ncbi:Capsid protein [uncultured Pleomorphomonas sp.]|uniref:Capsid protein n=2 Tax=Pleomorphomonas TaxID=261933 RepID=A0A2G9WV48_9HYPH|nr:capsid protein [Pleomorphomonas carboxyditropha]PIO98588.1 capsid protein [Pleomorphomonas carboxyditropha]SCM75435.1 Capsid protein [uncultured Pleomorphomonas sp.]